MANIEQDSSTTQLDLVGQGENALLQESGVTGGNETEGKASDEAVGARTTGDSEEGKEAERVPRKLSPASSPAMNASDQTDIPDPHPTPPLSSLSPPAAATVTSTPNRPPLIQHSSSQGHSGSSTPTTTTAPHPKKFSFININKKFLEKTTSASAATSTMATTSGSSKITGNGISRPPTQTSSAHPRLVTTKLTATTSSPSSTVGWSRPSSTAPPASVTGTSSPNGMIPTSSVPAATSSSTSTPTAPQLPHSGKVIQPVPRSTLGNQQVTPSTGLNKEGGSNAPSGLHSKPVWGKSKPPPTTVSRPDVMANDFPTAAEVAQGNANARKSKPAEQSAQEATAASSPIMTTKSSRNEEADTFRGVHLDPNAHHWDEMEEDDDNYWDNVIEFGDGRQYKVEEQTSLRSCEPSPPASVKSSQSTRLESDVPVSKEERFADDFDRSWPSGPKRGPSASTQQRSPQESARVLFNERSNKLEPYSSHRPGHGAFSGKRGGYQERMVSPVEPRSASSAFHGLSKGGGPPDFGSSRSRRLSNASSSSFVPSSDRPRDRDRRDGIPSSPRIPKDVIGLPGRPPSLRGRERNSEKDFGSFDRGRHSTMGPPPIPGHAWRNASRESVKQPLSSTGSVNGVAPLRRYPTQDESSDFQASSPVVRGPPHSPALSHTSLSTRAPMMSPVSSPLTLTTLAGQDLEELKKDVMHDAAARAKQRRQQEEEEREAQKERARKKAAELEAKIKGETEEREQKEARKVAEMEVEMKAETEEEVQKEKEAEQAKKEREQLDKRQQEDRGLNKVIEISPTSAEASDSGEKAREGAPDAEVQRQSSISKPLQRRPSGLQLSSDSGPSHRVSPTAEPSNGTSSTAEATDTWRRTAPLPLQPDKPRSIQRRFSNSATFMPPPPLDHIQTLVDGKQDLEVVDFSDMGRFVGETPTASTIEEREAPRKTSRPVASDFFDDVPLSSLPSQSLSPTAKNDIDNWRRKTPLNLAPMGEQQVRGAPSKDRSEGNTVADPSEQVHKANEGPVDGRHPNQISPTQRPPRSQNFYHQAPMSSLVDAITRIKGALHDIQVEESNRENHHPEAELSSTAPIQPTQGLPVPPSKPKDRWVPPSLRGRMVDFQEENPEEYYRSIVEPPRSPGPAWASFTVKLPSKSQHREPITRKQQHLFSRPPPPVYWDVLSFEPPVEGMNKRNLSVNDVLFRPFVGFKNKKYRVQLPRSRTRIQNAGQNSSRTNSFGTFGKQNGADSSSSWRKATSPLQPLFDVGRVTVEVNTTSRSPPPEPESPEPTLAVNLKTDTSSVENSAPLLRTRSQPKMPEGSSVAFYREPKAEPKTLVNFTVSSEIDGPQSPQSQSQSSNEDMDAEVSTTNDASEESTPEKVTSASVPRPRTNEVKEEKATSPATELETDRLPDPKKSEKSSHQSSPWLTSRSLSMKESPARAPDPEHLKAVWSQTSDKAGLHTTNSLEGIADDLTALPFTIQDVKSEDGETPPPTLGASSSRISLHDVTRAFQQVPPSSSSASHKPSISPPSTSAPVARPSPSNYSFPTPPNNMRPTYAAYPSPMMSHSPSPNVVYPHMVSSPVPARMQANGHAPMYNHMWVPVQPPTQVSNGMMRPIGPMASPYAPPLMAYPSSGAPTMYTHAMPANMPGTPQAHNMQANRNRTMPVMSPVMQHAGAHMYPASPAMMHMQMTPTTGYMSLPAGRGQPRPENGQTGMHQSNSTHPASSQVGFSPIPPSPYMRSW